MRLHSVEMRNIRSYREQQVELPGGITLLAGDIGSGKSTLLLAIEFALFGIARGELVGAALLRHGARDGSVHVAFSVGNTSYRIMRSLKRTASSIVQDTGWIETDGQRETLTPAELRARIFEILGYPLQFLGKQRNLLYRFTIYTPQEEMKAILSQTSDERIETIRRVFGIDAYRTMQENGQALARALRDRESTHEELLARLEQERSRLETQLAQEAPLRGQHGTLLQERSRLQAQLAAAEGEIAAAEVAHHALQERLRTRAMQERNRTLLLQQVASDRQLLDRRRLRAAESAKAMAELRARIAQIPKLPLEGLLQQHAALQKEIEALRQEEGKLLGILEECDGAPRLEAGTICPTCRQAVDAGHVEHLQQAVGAKRTAAQRKRERIRAQLAELRTALERSAGVVEQVREAAQLGQRLEQLELLGRQQAEETAQLEASLAQKEEGLRQLPLPAQDQALEEQSRRAAQHLQERRVAGDALRRQQLDLERRIARLEEELRTLAAARAQLAAVREDLASRQAARDRDARLRAWLLQQFLPFVSTVERHVLLSINAALDAAFRDWFSRLVENGDIAARIDHEFAPVVLQHGYETDVSHLSGGERTAVSLAYRLALAHTIHVLLPHLGTAGIIMLDEPTEGFSREQLERVCEVLRELRMDQILLVSHDQQLEGCVDHILRIRKDGESSVAQTI